MLGLLIADVVALLALAVYYSRYRPASTKQITDNVYVMSCAFLNFFAIKTAKGVILFDAGMEPRTTKYCLARIGVAPAEVTHVFLTHTDFDHAGGLTLFPHSKVYISKPEEQMINGETARRFFVHNKRLSNYSTLEDGETVDIDGVSIKTYVVPGHTPGTTAYLIDKRFLVSGDLLRVSVKGRITPFFWFININHKQNIASIKKILPVIKNAEYLLTGHTGVVKDTKSLIFPTSPPQTPGSSHQ
ncbi:MAG: MBL fold metallo-hydrolase [Lachnospiraceae bacterium]|jgi:glyoxylase-like metal-dependent hydrolase (beta-lactamase superfamily II)|nr:MBL fold metallo-hydrolase [Lachnospiraceae bacterium]